MHFCSDNKIDDLIFRFTQLQKFHDELKNRSRVLKKLGHVDADGVVQLKGRAACLIDTGDELLVTELMFNGDRRIIQLILFIYAMIYGIYLDAYGQVFRVCQESVWYQ